MALQRRSQLGPSGRKLIAVAAPGRIHLDEPLLSAAGNFALIRRRRQLHNLAIGIGRNRRLLWNGHIGYSGCILLCCLDNVGRDSGQVTISFVIFFILAIDEELDGRVSLDTMIVAEIPINSAVDFAKVKVL